MSRQSKRTRFFGSCFEDQLFDARLERITEEQSRNGSDIVFDLRPLRFLTSPEPRVVDGQPCEVIRAEYTAARLRFVDASWLRRAGPFECFNGLPADMSARRLFSVSHYRQPANGDFYWVVTGSEDPGDLAIRAQTCLLETIAGTPEPVEIVRRWARPPAPTPGLQPYRPAFHARHGGDPITIHLGNRILHNRLFIGGLHHQHERRPAVDHVLNLCGHPNPWCERHGQHPADRSSHRGEGPSGMSADALLEEATWVADRLHDGKRVLVHCYAGMNRSSTVCCAALILLEGITAEDALARVRRRHPLAWPDPYHWFTLQWLSRLSVAGGEAGMAKGAPLLREASTVG